jgi:hypothetical protein
VQLLTDCHRKGIQSTWAGCTQYASVCSLSPCLHEYVHSFRFSSSPLTLIRFRSAAYLDSGRLLMHLTLLRTRCVKNMASSSSTAQARSPVRRPRPGKASPAHAAILTNRSAAAPTARPEAEMRSHWQTSPSASLATLVHYLVSLGTSAAVTAVGLSAAERAGVQVHADDPGRPGHMRVRRAFPVVNALFSR